MNVDTYKHELFFLKGCPIDNDYYFKLKKNPYIKILLILSGILCGHKSKKGHPSA